MSREHFMSRDLELLESGVLADATITCGDKTWKVHKSIIRRCDWFNKAFSGNFEEAQTNKVNISAEDFSPEVVDCAISFIYSGGQDSSKCQWRSPGTLVDLCLVVNIEKANTHDSVPDASVQLWAIADFLVLKELKNEAITTLDSYCDEKVKAICASVVDHHVSVTSHDYGVLFMQLFRGVETAYTQYPHAVPCQQVLVSFFHAVRIFLFSKQIFSRAMSKAPLQFSHELFMATIGGRESKWTLEKVSDFKSFLQTGDCTYCKAHSGEHPRSFVVDPSMSGLSNHDKAQKVLWRCNSCFENHGFKRIRADDEKR